MKTHGPIQKEQLEPMNEIARTLDDIFNGPNCKAKDKKWGFALLTFSFGEPNDQSRINYISNSNRQDMIVALKEFIARNEGNYHEHKTQQ